MISSFAGRQNHLRLTLAFGLLSLGLTAAGPAFAFRGRLERVGAASAGIGRLDRDGDHKLSRDEHAAGAQEMFDSMDANHDAKVTATEMATAMAKVKGRRPSQSMKAQGLSPADRIKLIDRDGDGVLSAEENALAAKAMFDKMDANKDNLLDSAELANSHPRQAHKGRPAHK